MTCFYCGRPADHLHHIEFRSTRPDLIDDENNKCHLCVECHSKVHRSEIFNSLLKELWRKKQCEKSSQSTKIKY